MNSRAVIAIGALVLGMQVAAAEPVKLIFASSSPAGSPNASYFQQWVDKVNAAGNGLVEIEVRDGETIANFGNVYDRVTSDVIQIGWMLPGLLGSKFPLTEVVALPFTASDSVTCSAAYWRMYENGLLAEEYKDIQPIWVGCSDVTHMHFVEAPPNLDDLSGLKVRVKSKTESDAVTLLGGTPISMPSAEQYEALQRGTVDAINTGWAGFIPYKLNEVSKYHLEVPFGMAPSVHFMSRSKFDSLPQEVRELLLAHGGEARSKEMGQYFLDVAAKARDEAVAQNHTIVQLTDAQTAAWKARTASIAADWAKSREGGEAVLEGYSKAYAEIAGQ